MIKKKLMRKDGQSLIEFAIILPLLVLILVSIIEFGFIFSSYLAITNGAREGGRVASVGGSYASVLQKVDGVTPTLEDSRMNITMTYEEAVIVSGKSVTVTVTYNHPVITPMIGAFTGSEVLLKSEMTTRVE